MLKEVPASIKGEMLPKYGRTGKKLKGKVEM
jgi:hypothetical protein